MKKLFLLAVLFVAMRSSGQIVNLSDTGLLRSYINTVIVNNNIRSITAQNFNNVLNGFLNTYVNDSITLSQGTSNDTLWFWKRRSKSFYVLLRVGTLSAITQYSSLTDVSLTTLSDGQLAKWNAATSRWNNFTLDKSFIGLGSVENTALSTWAGSASINRVGTIANGIWNGSPISDQYISSASNWNGKQNAIPLGTSSQYFKGDLSLGNFSPSTVGLGNVQNVDQTNASNLSSGSIPAGRYGNATVPVSAISATGGTSTDYLRKDGTWATPPGSGGVSAYASLTDVVLTSLANSQLMKYNLSTSKWNNFTPGSSDVIAWLGYTPMNPTGTTSQYWRGNGSLATFPTDLSSFGNSPGYLSGTVGASNGGSGLASYTPYSILAAGTTSTGNYQQIGIGTAGQVLTSNGPGALPTMQNPPTSSAFSTLTDVAITSIANGQLVKWNSTTSKWNNFAPGSADVLGWLGYTPMNPNGTTSQYFKGDGSKGTFPANVSFFINDANYLTGITSAQIIAALTYTPINPNGTTLQYFRGDGSKATADTGMIPSFYAKVRSLITAAAPLRFTNGGLSIDTAASVLTNLVSYAYLFNNLDTISYYHNGPIWLSYTNGTKTVFDKGLKNTGTVLFTTGTDSAIVANADTLNKIATRYDLTRLNAANLFSGTIPVARYGASTIPLTAINATGTPGSTTYLRGDGIWAAGGFNANLNVFPTPAGDSIQISTGLSAFLPLVTSVNAGAMSPAYKARIDSVQNFANTRHGDSVMWWNGIDTFWVKGITVQNDGNMVWTSHSTQQEVIWGGAVDTAAGATKIPTRGEIARGYIPIPSGSNQGFIPFFRSNGTLAASPLQNDTANSRLVSSKPLNFSSAVIGSDITSAVTSSKLLGISYTGSSSSGYFEPLQALVNVPALFTVIQNTGTATAGNGSSAGMQIFTSYGGGDAYTQYNNATSGASSFITGLTQRFGGINMWAVARGPNSSFFSSSLLMGLDSAGNLKLPKYGSAGNLMLYVDNSGNVLTQAIPAAGLSNPMTAAGDMIIGGVSGTGQRLAAGANSTFLKVISGVPAWAALSKSDVGLSAVENTALSSWAGSTNLTTLGPITSGSWTATRIGLQYGGTNADLSATGGAGRVLKQASTGAAVTVAQVLESELSFSDVTSNNVSSSAHGFIPKIPGTANTYFSGAGTYTDPISAANIVGLSYSPSITNVNNVNNVTVVPAFYTRIGNIVHVSGWFQFKCITANTQSTVTIALPVASNVGSNGLSGVASVYDQDGLVKPGFCTENGAGNAANMTFQCGASAGGSLFANGYYQFSYIVQ